MWKIWCCFSFSSEYRDARLMFVEFVFLGSSYTGCDFDYSRVRLLLFRIIFEIRSNGFSWPCLEPHYPSPQVTVPCATLLCANFVRLTVRISSLTEILCCFVFIELLDTRLLFYGFVSCFFLAHRGCPIVSWVAIVITLHLISLILRVDFMRGFHPSDDPNIFRGYCVVFRFSSRLFRFRISISWSSLSRMAALIRHMGVLGHASATNIFAIPFICERSRDFYFNFI